MHSSVLLSLGERKSSGFSVMSTFRPVAAHPLLAYKQLSISFLIPTTGRAKYLVKLSLAILIAVCMSIAASAARAGGGPENIILLVNTNSEASKTIANNYINWRQIPAGNVLYLDWKGVPSTISGEVFRETILLPTLPAHDQPLLEPQVDYIVYSSDFPWRIDMRQMLAGQ